MSGPLASPHLLFTKEEAKKNILHARDVLKLGDAIILRGWTRFGDTSVVIDLTTPVEMYDRVKEDLEMERQFRAAFDKFAENQGYTNGSTLPTIGGAGLFGPWPEPLEEHANLEEKDTDKR